MPTSKKAKIRFFSHDIHSNLKNTRNLRHFIETIFRKHRRKLESLNYIFCNDKFLLSINKSYLNHDFYTDVITFNLSPNCKVVHGEVYVSIDRVRENAKNLGVPIKYELHRVIFHAALHLCEYDDKTKKDLKKMRKVEDKLLSKYFND